MKARSSVTAELEVTFNSPQCGWMSVGFNDGESEFHTTTAQSPHPHALSNLITALTEMLEATGDDWSKTLKWNRDPEEFDFIFKRSGNTGSFEIVRYPTRTRDLREGRKVFSHSGEARKIALAFCKTIAQLYEERDVDEFEENWNEGFPDVEFSNLKNRLFSG